MHGSDNPPGSIPPQGLPHQSPCKTDLSYPAQGQNRQHHSLQGAHTRQMHPNHTFQHDHAALTGCAKSRPAQG
eukprot:15366565-Ditylum_brightwellii.AAC.2